jgi:hypothetical protein
MPGRDDAHMCRVTTDYDPQGKERGAGVSARPIIGMTWHPEHCVSYVGLSRAECMANAEMFAAAPRFARALLAEGPEFETITRLQQLVKDMRMVAASYERAAEMESEESTAVVGHSACRTLESFAQTLSDLLAGLAASQEKKAPDLYWNSRIEYESGRSDGL